MTEKKKVGIYVDKGIWGAYRSYQLSRLESASDGVERLLREYLMRVEKLSAGSSIIRSYSKDSQLGKKGAK